MNYELNKVVRVLRVFFWAPIAISVMFVVLYESNILLPGGLDMADQGQYIMLAIVELITLAVIPLCLYLFRSKGIRRQLSQRPTLSLMRFGILRLIILGAGLVFNTLLYYMSMTPSYGYLAIIIAIAMTFIYPSKKRCEKEISPTPSGEEEPHPQSPTPSEEG